ncbi:MAG: Ig-like domain-containing protein [Lachnospiraceae bacterium]|nr:Ig-like domain-containing protein [Lachnospiraceae bacterium]
MFVSIHKKIYRFFAAVTAAALILSVSAGDGALSGTVKAMAATDNNSVLSFADLSQNGNSNIYAQIENNNHFGYGLCIARVGDSEATLQMYAPGSDSFPEGWHYLRKLEGVDYRYTAEAAQRLGVDAAVQPVESDIAPGDLAAVSSDAVWESSDPAVVEADPVSGMLTAKAAGSASITVSRNDGAGSSSSISFDVLVAPGARISTDTEGYSSSLVYRADPGENSIVLRTNSNVASDLSWHLFQGDVAKEGCEVTDIYSENLDISDINDRVVLNDLPAGVYTLVATQPQFADASSKGFKGVNIDRLTAVIIVPVEFDTDDVTLEYYNKSVYDSCDLLGGSNLPDGLFTFISENDNIAYVDPDSGIAEARGVGETRIVASPVSEAQLMYVFGSYYGGSAASGSAISVAGGNGSSGSNSSGNGTASGSNSAGSNASGSGTGLGTATVVSGSGVASGGAISGGSVTSGSAIGYNGGNFYINVKVVNAIALNTTSETLPVGNVLQLSLTAPSHYTGRISWSSSNTRVATVDANGMVEAVGIGSANIVARITVKNITKTARCKIKVEKAVVNVSLTSGSSSLLTGGTMDIAVAGDSVALKGSYEFSSSDSSVASVENISDLSATVTGLRSGTVVITAYDENKDIIATKQIRVIHRLDSLNLSETGVSIPLSSGTYRLYAECNPVLTGDAALTWSSSEANIASVDNNGNITLAAVGTTVITVESEDGHKAECRLTVTDGNDSRDSGSSSGGSGDGGNSGSGSSSSGSGDSGNSESGSSSGGSDGSSSGTSGDSGSGSSGSGSSSGTSGDGGNSGSGSSSGGSGSGSSSGTSGSGTTSPTPEITPLIIYVPEYITPAPTDGGKASSSSSATPAPTSAPALPDKTTVKDKDGNVTIYDIIRNKDGSVSTIKTITGADGSVSVVEMIERGDGTGSFRTTNTDADGNKRIFRADMDKTGKVEVNTVETDISDKYGNRVEHWEMTSADGAYTIGLKVTGRDGRENYELLEMAADGKVKITVSTTNPNGDKTKKVFTSTDTGKLALTKYATDRRLAAVSSSLILSDNSRFSVVSVAKNSFKNNTDITRVTIGKSVKTIGKNAFNGASRLKTIVIYSDVLSKVGKGAFKNIAENALIQIVGDKASYKKAKKKIKASGIGDGVKFERVEDPVTEL